MNKKVKTPAYRPPPPPGRLRRLFSFGRRKGFYGGRWH